MGAALLHPQPPFTEEKRSVDQELIKDIPVIVVIERAVDDARVAAMIDHRLAKVMPSEVIELG